MSGYTCFQGNFKFFTHSLAFDKTCSCHIVIFNSFLDFLNCKIIIIIIIIIIIMQNNSENYYYYYYYYYYITIIGDPMRLLWIKS